MNEWSPTALEPWPLPQRFVGRNPPTRRPKTMGDVPKTSSLPTPPKQPLRLRRPGAKASVDTLIHSRSHRRGFLRFAEEDKAILLKDIAMITRIRQATSFDIE